jgi:hypothetical protein
MSLPISPIPAPGYSLISGKRSPPDNGTQYMPQYRNGYVDRWTYTAKQLRWVHDGSAWDVVAINRAKS